MFVMTSRTSLNPRKASGFFTLVLIFSFSACAPVGPEKNIPVSINFEIQKKDSSLSSGYRAQTLSNNYCYAIMVTGDSPETLNRYSMGTSQNSASCPYESEMPTKLGLMQGIVPLGTTLEFDVPAGNAREFFLFGIRKTPTSNEYDVPPVDCLGTLTAEPIAPTSIDEKDVAFYLNGVEVDYEISLIAKAEANIIPGIQTITLQTITDQDGVSMRCDSGSPSSSGGTAGVQNNIILTTNNVLEIATLGVDDLGSLNAVPISATNNAVTSFSGTPAVASGTAATTTTSLSLSSSIAPVVNLLDTTRMFDLFVSQTGNASACVFENPNSFLTCSFNTIISLAFSDLNQISGGQLRVWAEGTTSNTLSVKKLGIQKIGGVLASGTSENVSSNYAYNGKLYFRSETSPHFSLYEYNGAEFRQITDGTAGYSSLYTAHQGKIYMNASDSGYDKLFVYDPTNGTVEKRLELTSSTTFETVQDMISDGNHLYFTVPISGNYSLYKMTTSTGVVEKVSNTSNNSNDDIRYLTLGDNGFIYFVANNTLGMKKVFKLNTTNGLTEVISQISASTNTSEFPKNLLFGFGKLFFTATDLSYGRERVFVYDPGNGSVQQITQTGGTPFSDFETTLGPDLTIYDGKIYFSGQTAGGNLKLFRIDPTSLQVEQISDILNGQTDGVAHLTVHNGSLYFVANAASAIKKLFRYQSSTNQIQQVSNIAGSITTEGILNLTSVGADLYFTALDSSYIRKWYRLREY
jgi:hypothetical protein